MKYERIIELMNKIAPPELAADFDNAGLLVDGDGRDIKRVLVALDCTDKVAEEAALGGYDMIIAHHPLLFHPIKQVISTRSVTSVLHTLIKNGIALFCAHTNLDIADGGVNDVLARLYDLKNCVKVEPGCYGRVGDLSTPVSLLDFVHLTNRLLNTHARCAVAHYRDDPENIMIRRVGVLGGAGGDDVEAMVSYGADVFVTGEIKHSRAIDAQHYGLNVIEAGHYETERVVLPVLISYLQNANSDVEYNLSGCEKGYLRTF